MKKLPQKSLKQLLDDLPVERKIKSNPERIPVSGIQFDSRKVGPGDLFVALTGGSSDGHSYIAQAIRSGAVAVVGTKGIADLSVPYIQVADSREALAHLAAAFFDHPARKLTVIGVTGTDGKTTTSNLIFQILKKAGIKAGLISTVNAVIAEDVIDTGFHVTTPEATDVQHYLSKMVESGLTHVILETTSHGLAQHRVTGCEYDIAVVTNITHEHLDYHGNFESYRDAKARLFVSLNETTQKLQGNPHLSILNADDQSYSYLDYLIPDRKCAYSIHQPGDLMGKEIQHSSSGVDFVATGKDFSVPVHFGIPGDFNVSNCLAALAATIIGLGIDPLIAAEGIAELKGIPGRMEPIDLGQSFSAIVDFAHTPNALQNALEATRQMTKGRVIAIFGSAGLRDRQKRRMMAEVSIKLADLTILTAEDPRTESLEGILADMADAASQAGGIENQTFYRVPDRPAAIRLGVSLARAGDVVISCGKGHEQSMCFDAVEYPWDDRTAMRAALGEYLAVQGPEMPKLPTST
ncbi:MAG: UDP-N-acetylmuramoyl-L-alanyl-D-glutamate--2,6-diaminopimelate ligase [Chloroflexi bacterium]|nr:UDP-N-acetylmuramoyl-L-alanyl-D-glutamate--2,6-diaminopimelate ligase [Chloroflexota bacterium]